MKVKIYFDVYPWTTGGQDIYFALIPSSTKSADATRYLVEVEIPDPAKPDVKIIAEAKEIE